MLKHTKRNENIILKDLFVLHVLQALLNKTMRNDTGNTSVGAINTNVKCTFKLSDNEIA